MEFINAALATLLLLLLGDFLSTFLYHVPEHAFAFFHHCQLSVVGYQWWWAVPTLRLQLLKLSMVVGGAHPTEIANASIR
ncbi:MAG: hypothetical protein AB4352_02910 [Hormoscilla sp.]